MTAIRFHGKKERLGLEFRGQGEAKTEIGIAVGGSRQPRYLGVGLGRCDGAEKAEADEKENNVLGRAWQVERSGRDSSTIEFSGKS